jgi:5'-3' exonuclease
MKCNILIDANNLFHRSYAIHVKDKPPELQLTNVRGYPTGLTYGVYSMLESWMGDFPNFTRIMLFMDGVPKRRLQIDNMYKFKEEKSIAPGKSPASIKLLDGYEAKNELDVIFHVASKMGIDIYHGQEEEADDLIASFIHQNREDVNVLISSDKDFFQLLEKYPKLVLYRPGVSGRRIYDSDVATEHMEKLCGVAIKPREIIMFKALTGDPSDGIHGVPRLRKKVLAPLCYCQTIDELIATGMPRFSKKEKENTISLREKLMVNLELIRLIDDLNIESFKVQSDENFDVAKLIMKEDLDIHAVSVNSFRPTSARSLRTSEPVVPDWLSDI